MASPSQIKLGESRNEDNIYVQIPAWEIIKDTDNNIFAAYIIELSGGDGMLHILSKRYSDFYKLRRALRHHYDHKHHFRGFPKKRYFFNLSERYLEERRVKFEHYLNGLIELAPLLDDLRAELARFLQVDEDFLSALTEDPPPLPPPASPSLDTSSISGASERMSYSTEGNTFLFPTAGIGESKLLPRPMKITGYINKSKRYTKSVKRRFFELKTVEKWTTLTYFNADDSVRDTVDLLVSSIQSSPGSKGFKIVVDCKSSYPWVLRFDEEKERDYWLSALSYHKAYGLSQVPLMHRGFLYKRGHIVKSWKKRYFVMESSPLRCLLTYYAREIDDPPYGEGVKGIIDLQHYALLPDGGGGVEGEGEGLAGEDDVERPSELDVDEDDAAPETEEGGRVDDPQLVIVLQAKVKSRSRHIRYHLQCASAEEKAQWLAALEAHLSYYVARNPEPITTESAEQETTATDAS